MLTTTALALLASALSAIGAPSLSLTLEGASSVENIDNFSVNATITNVGDETLQVLNDPNGPLSKAPANTFSVANSKGALAQFVGIKAKYVPKAAAKVGAFTTLAPGDSVTVTHDLSDAYNLTTTGVDTYEVQPVDIFHVLQKSGEIVSVRAEAGKAHKARVSGRLAKAKPATAIERRASYVGCTADQQTILVDASAAAQAYALSANTYLAAMTGPTDRYTAWFGTITPAAWRVVLSHFTAISSNVFSSFIYNCECTDPDVYAFVYPQIFGTINVCPLFWSSLTVGIDTQGGTLVHEASHFERNGGTDDIVWGATGAAELAIADPASAIRNADNHEYFAENTPALP